MTQRAAFFDLAGTVTRTEPWGYIMEHPKMEGRRIRMVYTWMLPFWLGRKLKVVNEMLFRDRWVREMATLFRGWTHAEINSLGEWLIHERMRDDFYPDVVERVREHLARGEHVVFVSGVFGDISAKMAEHLGANAGLGTPLAYRGETCTGKLAGLGCNGTRKLNFIRDYLRSNNLSTDMSLHYAYADSYSDLPMLSAVGNPVATRPDEQLRRVAESRKWAIIG